MSSRTNESCPDNSGHDSFIREDKTAFTIYFNAFTIHLNAFTIHLNAFLVDDELSGQDSFIREDMTHSFVRTWLHSQYIWMRQFHIWMRQCHIGMRQFHIGMRQFHIWMRQFHIWTRRFLTCECVVKTHVNESCPHEWTSHVPSCRDMTHLFVRTWLIRMYCERDSLTCVVKAVTTAVFDPTLHSVFEKRPMYTKKETCIYQKRDRSYMHIWLIRVYYAVSTAVFDTAVTDISEHNSFGNQNMTHSHVRTWLIHMWGHDSFTCIVNATPSRVLRRQSALQRLVWHCNYSLIRGHDSVVREKMTHSHGWIMRETPLLSSVPEGTVQIQNITKETHIHYKRDQYIPQKRPIKHKEETYIYKQKERYQRELCKRHL